MIRFFLNNRLVTTREPPGSTVLDFIRRAHGLTGTREGCREGDCGACTILLGEQSEGGPTYSTAPSCLLPLGEAEGKHVVTIEGLNPEGIRGQSVLNPIQQAFVDEGAIQCGFCTSGMILSVTGFFLSPPTGDRKEILRAIDGNICRCTGYMAIRRAAEGLRDRYGDLPVRGEDRIEALVNLGILPEWFTTTAARMKEIDRSTTLPGGTTRPGSDSSVVALAGGTDLLVRDPDALKEADILFLTQNGKTPEACVEKDSLVVDGAMTFEGIRRSTAINRLCPGLAGKIDLVASLPIRNRATLAGNIVNASPAADLTIVFLALDAALRLNGQGRKRTVPLRAFFKGYKEPDLAPGEIVTHVIVPRAGTPRLFNFEKVSRRKRLDIASVNSAIAIEMTGDRMTRVSLSAGGVAPTPTLLSAASAALENTRVSAKVIRAACALADSETAPISDVRGSASYKRLLLRRLIIAHFLALFPDEGLEGELP
jgi:xanthine dehydrogenase small subunit